MWHQIENVHQNSHLFWVLAQLISLWREKSKRMMRFIKIFQRNYAISKRQIIISSTKRHLPWLLSDWMSGFLFLPLVVSDCFFSGVWKRNSIELPFVMVILQYVGSFTLVNKHVPPTTSWDLIYYPPNKQENCLFSHLTPVGRQRTFLAKATRERLHLQNSLKPFDTVWLHSY